MSSVIPLEFSEQRVKILSSSPRGSRGVEPGGVVLVVKEGGRDGGGGGDCASCFTANSATAIFASVEGKHIFRIVQLTFTFSQLALKVRKVDETQGVQEDLYTGQLLPALHVGRHVRVRAYRTISFLRMRVNFAPRPTQHPLSIKHSSAATAAFARQSEVTPDCAR